MWHAWERNMYRVLVGKPEGKRPLEKSRRRWEDGIRMDLREIGWGESVEWIQLDRVRCRWRDVVNTACSGATYLVSTFSLPMSRPPDPYSFTHHSKKSD
jgi:hypothetical protein